MKEAERKLELLAMKMPELVSLGKDLGVKIGLRANKRGAVSRIVKAEQAKAGTPAPIADRPPSPDFERLAGPEGSEDRLLPGFEADAERPTRGGARPGAGRPLGMTDEKARMATLPQMPNPAIEGALCMAFEAWAKLADCPEIALTKDEAVRLALPYTQLAHYFGIDDHIPPWAILGITAAWTTWEIVKARLAILDAKAKQAQAAEAPAGPIPDKAAPQEIPVP